jgi:hypothetical protein
VRVLKDHGLVAGDEAVIRAIGRGRTEAERAEAMIDRSRAVFPPARICPAISIDCVTNGAAGARSRIVIALLAPGTTACGRGGTAAAVVAGR